jgi:hypothetical protein
MPGCSWTESCPALQEVGALRKMSSPCFSSIPGLAVTAPFPPCMPTHLPAAANLMCTVCTATAIKQLVDRRCESRRRDLRRFAGRSPALHCKAVQAVQYNTLWRNLPWEPQGSTSLRATLAYTLFNCIISLHIHWAIEITLCQFR